MTCRQRTGGESRCVTGHVYLLILVLVLFAHILSSLSFTLLARATIASRITTAGLQDNKTGPSTTRTLPSQLHLFPIDHLHLLVLLST